jgi:hypothetical protein
VFVFSRVVVTPREMISQMARYLQTIYIVAGIHQIVSGQLQLQIQVQLKQKSYVLQVLLLAELLLRAGKPTNMLQSDTQKRNDQTLS